MILKTELLAHQKAAFDKVSRHKVGALFMDMGTGKSRVAIELIYFYRQRGITKAIWICPVNTMNNIMAELDKHTEGLDVYMFNGKTVTPPPADVYIVGTESISQSTRAWLALEKIVDGSLMIVDESHDFRSPNSVRSKRLLSISPRTAARYVMTGTPIGKGFEDLFVPVTFLSKKILGYSSFRTFSHYHLEFDPDNPGRVKKRFYGNYVTTKVAPYAYQVKKDECLTLPEKTYSDYLFGLDMIQRRVYSEVKEQIINECTYEDAHSGVMIYKLFSALQRVCCGIDPRNNSRIFDQPDENPRIAVLLSLVERLPSDSQAIVWAKYQTDINDIMSVLPDAVPLHGEMKLDERRQSLDKFRSGARFLVATPGTGGIGLTLNEASYGIFYSQSFKYIHRVQAEDRSHRIGQTKNVHYMTISSGAKIEQIILHCLGKSMDADKWLDRELAKVRSMTKEKDIKKALKAMV